MKIVIVEDDVLHVEDLRRELAARYTRDSVELEHLATELSFVQRVDALAQSPPDLFLIDAVLPWRAVSDTEAPPPKGDPDEAGFRCTHLLGKHLSLATKPVIILSVLDGSDRKASLAELPANACFMSKDDDFSELLVRIDDAWP